MIKMWNEIIFEECRSYFLKLSHKGDYFAESFLWLLDHVGIVSAYDDLCLYNRVIETVLTQRINFKKSAVVKRNLSSLMGKREFSPEELIEMIDNSPEELQKIDIDERLRNICKEVSLFTIRCLERKDKKKLSIRNVEKMIKNIKGIGPWTVNVSLIGHTFTKSYTSLPYNVLTNRDPVIKKGFFWLTGIEPYNSVIDQTSQMYSPYSGILTRYIWEAFNYNRIFVRLPLNYKKWWNKGKNIDFACFKVPTSQRNEHIQRQKSISGENKFRRLWLDAAKKHGYMNRRELYIKVKQDLYKENISLMRKKTSLEDFELPSCFKSYLR